MAYYVVVERIGQDTKPLLCANGEPLKFLTLPEAQAGLIATRLTSPRQDATYEISLQLSDPERDEFLKECAPEASA